MTALQLADRIGNVDAELIRPTVDLWDREGENCGKGRPEKLRRILPLAAAVIAILALCGFIVVYYGLSDFWLQEPSADPIEVVRSAIENQAKKEYTITVRVDEITIDGAETERVIEMYSGSELADFRGWSDEYLQNHFVVVRAKYYSEYDHTKTPVEDGDTIQYFYLVENMDTGEWTISDNTGPIVPNPVTSP